MLLSTLNTSIKSPNPHPIDTKLKLRSQIYMVRTQPLALCAESPEQAPALAVRGGRVAWGKEGGLGTR